jgi:hypothetical protein
VVPLRDLGDYRVGPSERRRFGAGPIRASVSGKATGECGAFARENDARGSSERSPPAVDLVAVADARAGLLFGRPVSSHISVSTQRIFTLRHAGTARREAQVGRNECEGFGLSLLMRRASTTTGPTLRHRSGRLFRVRSLLPSGTLRRGLAREGACPFFS